jgi:flagellar biosynthetic protein FliR
MSVPLTELALALPAFALVLFRITGLMLTAPLYASRVIPMRVRAGLAMLLAGLMFPLVRSPLPAGLTLDVALIGGVGEMMVGAIIGLALGSFLLGGEVAGLAIGQQAGLALADVFDPTRNQPATVIGQVYVVVLTVFFLLAGGHRAAIAAVLDTYRVIPVLSYQYEEPFLVLLVEMVAAAFVLGVRLAGPVLIALLLMGIALAFLSRTMPQFNILSVGFNLRLLVALALASMALALSGDLVAAAVTEAVERTRAAFGLDPARTRLVS